MNGQLTSAPDKVNRKFEIRGLNHIAMVCADMKRTVDFYEGILGMPLIKTHDFGKGQHFFFDMGRGASFAFFWLKDAPAALPGPTTPAYLSLEIPIGSMNHFAFDVDAARLPEYRERLMAAGVDVSPIVHHDDVSPSGTNVMQEEHESTWVTSIYFKDPDGIQLEFAGWRRVFTEADIRHEPATAEDAARYKREKINA
ncbi:VOC family protein [Achromobacter pestifer]|uniref:VOC family protein n=2 Tax=Achromobacter pestifer TaxID=1353889 RepID=A0A7D4IDI5_9BURK|nr:VOC family protein [Achromobacter pestifer]